MNKPPDTRPYELALLRGIFDPQAARDTVQAGNTKLFSEGPTRDMYSAFLKLHFDRVPVTVDAVRLEMATSSDVDDAVTVGVLEEIMDLPVPTHPKRLIDGLASLRKRQLLHDLHEYLDTPEAVKDSMAGAIAKINEFTHTTHTLSSAGKVETLWDTMLRIMEREGPSRVWEVGLGDYLNRNWIIRKPSYTVIAADSGSGKTAMLIQIAKHIASQGTNVGIISLEMTKEELTFRAAAQDAGVDSSRIEDNLITDEERAVIMATIQQRRAIYERFYIMDDSSMTVEQLPAKYNEFVAKHQCEVILIDYIQRVSMAGRNNGKVDVVTTTSEMITALTKSLGVATIALSTLNEATSSFDGAGSGRGKRKGLSNLKNARQIGHDASMVVILTMITEKDDPLARGIDSPEKYIMVDSVKNRKGGWFCKPLHFHGPTQRYSDDGMMVELR